MFRSVYLPSKEKPKTKDCCGKIFGCQQCRHAIREWKRNESFRKSLARAPINTDLVLFKFSIFAMSVCGALAGLLIMQENHDGAFQCLCGAFVWAICIFIFDHNAKED